MREDIETGCMISCLLCPTLCDPMDYISCQAPLSVEFSQQEHWSGLPFLPPGNLPKPGIKPSSLACPASAAGFFTTAPPGKPKYFSSVNIVSQIFFINEKHKILFFKVISQHEMYLFLNKNETYYFSARLRI